MLYINRTGLYYPNVKCTGITPTSVLIYIHSHTCMVNLNLGLKYFPIKLIKWKPTCNIIQWANSGWEKNNGFPLHVAMFHVSVLFVVLPVGISRDFKM